MENIVQRTFPLLQLPPDAQKNVLRNFKVIELLGFSLRSKGTKKLVMSMKLRAVHTTLKLYGSYRLELQFNNRHNISLEFFNNQEQNNRMLDGQFQHVESVQARCFTNDWEEAEYDDDVYYWRNPQFTSRDWLLHILSMCHCLKLCRIEFGVPTIDVKILKDNLKKLGIIGIVISEDMSNQYACEVLDQFFHAESIELIHSPFETIKRTHRFLVQHVPFLWLGQRFPISVDDLIMMNSPYITKDHSNWTDKHMNRFLKLWRAGSNPNLKYLHIGPIKCGTNENITLKGLNPQVLPKNKLRFFDKLSIESATGVRFDKTEVRGGTDIQRYDGTCATIITNSSHNIYYLQLFVWP